MKKLIAVVAALLGAFVMVPGAHAQNMPTVGMAFTTQTVFCDDLEQIKAIVVAAQMTGDAMIGFEAFKVLRATDNEHGEPTCQMQPISGIVTSVTELGAMPTHDGQLVNAWGVEFADINGNAMGAVLIATPITDGQTEAPGALPRTWDDRYASVDDIGVMPA